MEYANICVSLTLNGFHFAFHFLYVLLTRTHIPFNLLLMLSEFSLFSDIYSLLRISEMYFMLPIFLNVFQNKYNILCLIEKLY